MNKEMQNSLWAILSKEAREEIKLRYKQYKLCGKSILKYVFGPNNITSSIDPDEMLVVKRSEVQRWHQWIMELCKVSDKELTCLYGLFGDKCFSDTTDNENLFSSDNRIANNVEDNKLNLIELLKGCEGEKFYSRAYGELTLNEIVRDDREWAREIKLYTPDPHSDRVWFYRDGRKYPNGEIDLFPSRTLYEKYPLKPLEAWSEWIESQKPKRWRARVGEEYWHIDSCGNASKLINAPSDVDDRLYKFGNMFRTKEECEQAAEEVHETLKAFRERLMKK